MPFADANDQRVHYLEAGRGDALLLIHGNWASAGWWEPTLARLSSGLRGLAYDMRGRGQTSGPDSDYRVPSLAADALALADALGIERLHVCGHSLGAAVAAQVALDAPGRVRSLTLLAPAWVDGMPDLLYSPARQQMLAENFGLFAQALRAVAATAPDDEHWRRLVAEGHRQRLAATLGAQEALRAWRPGDSLRDIPCPKLVLGGALDPLITAPVCERAAQALGASLALLPGVGHSPNIEAPDAFARALFAHIASS